MIRWLLVEILPKKSYFVLSVDVFVYADFQIVVGWEATLMGTRMIIGCPALILLIAGCLEFDINA